MNVHYLQNTVFSFEGSDGQNHSLSDSHHPRFPILLLGGRRGDSPLKYVNDNANDNRMTQYRNFRLLKTL